MKRKNAPVLRIRRARAGDASGIAALCGQLGYPVSAAEMTARLKQVLRQKNCACFVAETRGRDVIGWVHVSFRPLLEVDRRAEIDGIIVDENARSTGVGARLLEEGEKWARHRRCNGVSLRSNVIRDKAHGFYIRQGYEHYKTQKAFRKIF